MRQPIPILDVFLCPNGMVAVFDERGKQIPELQGFFLESIPKIVKLVSRDTNFWFGGERFDTPWWFEGKEAPEIRFEGGEL